jgi:phosphoglycerate dehydrogenase-like enzyme
VIVAAGPLVDPGPALLEPWGPVVVAGEGELDGLLAEAVGLVARGPTRVPAERLERAGALRVIGRTGIGTDLIDLAAATARGIPVVVTPGAATDAVAEGAIALLLALAKRLPALDRMVRDGRWSERDAAAPADLIQSTLVVVGAGRTGRRVADLAGALGMHVLLVDEGDDLDAALREADHVSLHVPLTAATRGLITAERLAQARPGLRLVNMARGAVAPPDELLAALEAGTLGGVGLDVFEPEPPDLAHPLFRRPEVLCSPHALALTPRAQRAAAQAMAEGMAAVPRGGRAESIANPEVYG